MYNPNWRTHIFQRGRYTTNQSTYLNIKQFSHLCIACQLNISAAVSSGPSPPGPRFVPTKRPSWSHRHGAEVRPQRGEGRLPPAVRRRTGALLGAGAEGGTPGHVAQEGAIVKGGRDGGEKWDLGTWMVSSVSSKDSKAESFQNWRPKTKGIWFPNLKTSSVWSELWTWTMSAWLGSFRAGDELNASRFNCLLVWFCYGCWLHLGSQSSWMFLA